VPNLISWSVLIAADSGLALRWLQPEGSPMSPRPIYLRDQAAKCRWYAKNIGDAETQNNCAS
jgi:hypothetical protein